MKRRDFLKVGMGGAAVFAFSGLTFMAPRECASTRRGYLRRFEAVVS